MYFTTSLHRTELSLVHFTGFIKTADTASFLQCRNLHIDSMDNSTDQVT